MDSIFRRFDPEAFFRGSMVVVGIYAAIRYGSEWAYALGKFAGAS